MICLKKIILLLIVILLTGCFEDSGTLTKFCTKEDKANTLTVNTTYTFTFKQDVISDLKVGYHYTDTNSSTIDAIKLSYKSQNALLENISYNVLEDKENEYKVEYTLPLQENELIKDKFVIKTKRSELVQELKEQGFVCD